MPTPLPGRHCNLTTDNDELLHPQDRSQAVDLPQILRRLPLPRRTAETSNLPPPLVSFTVGAVRPTIIPTPWICPHRKSCGLVACQIRHDDAIAGDEDDGTMRLQGKILDPFAASDSNQVGIHQSTIGKEHPGSAGRPCHPFTSAWRCICSSFEPVDTRSKDLIYVTPILP